MFTPKWKKDALHLAKGGKKFIDYKRDMLPEDRVAEIDSRRTDLIRAVRSGDRAMVNEAAKQLQNVCEKALPHEKPLNWLEENVEVMFVAIVIALGLRSYYLQPFRIPTGSMQPTLNGIIGTPLPKAEWPSLPQRVVEKVLRGRSYVRVVNDRDRHVGVTSAGGIAARDVQWLHFFSRSELAFSDSPPIRLPAPLNPCREIGLQTAMAIAGKNRGLLPKGTVLVEGMIDSGDLVLVDKFSYHFRKPKRGEVFVFDTIGIQGIHQRSGDQAAGSHYIKRLCGIPGDTITINSPHVLIDGNIAKEPGMVRVSEAKGPYAINPKGYTFADAREAAAHRNMVSQYLAKPGDSMPLAGKGADQGMREYLALGDNTGNSLDSRYWGTVKEFNLVGPALFSLWPISTGHWGFIR